MIQTNAHKIFCKQKKNKNQPLASLLSIPKIAFHSSLLTAIVDELKFIAVPKSHGLHSLTDYYHSLSIFSVASGGSRGGAAGARPPYGSRFFRFDIQIFLNVAASGVGAPYEVGAPLQEILDPRLVADPGFSRGGPTLVGPILLR